MGKAMWQPKRTQFVVGISQWNLLEVLPIVLHFIFEWTQSDGKAITYSKHTKLQLLLRNLKEKAGLFLYKLKLQSWLSFHVYYFYYL